VVRVPRQAVWQQLAARVPHLAIFLLQHWVVEVCMRDLQGFW